MPTESLLLLGAGGHAAVVFDAIRAADGSRCIVVRDDDHARAGRAFFEITVQAPIAWDADGCTAFHVAIGANAIRERLQRQGGAHGLPARLVAHPRATISPLSRIGAGSFVAAGAVVAPAAALGEGVIVNHGAVIDHDCVVDDFSHLAPNSTLGGKVIIGRRVLIGAGAVVLPGRRVGDDAIVGAGAVVSRDVAPGSVVAGVPARNLRQP